MVQSGVEDVSILDPRTTPALTPKHLERLVTWLEAHGDVRLLLQLMSAWSTEGRPTRTARLAQARALLELGQVDRAWIRLRDLLESDPTDLECTRLITRMFIQRGWHRKAVHWLERAREHHPEDPELAAQARVLEEGSSSVAPPPEPSGSVDDQLGIVTIYVSRGQNIRAEQTLRQLQKRHPDHPRIHDLLWALRGALLPDTPLLELAAQARQLQLEVTEAARAPAALGPAQPASSEGVAPGDTGAFPSLFRDASPSSEPDVPHPPESRTGEITRTRPGDAQPQADDERTRVRRVPPGGPSVSPSSTRRGALHRGDTETSLTPVDTTRERPSSRAASHFSISDDPDPLEEEDEALIVFTRQGEDDPTLFDSLDLDPATDTHPRAEAFLIEAERIRRHTTRPPARPTAPDSVPPPPPAPVDPPQPPWWLLIFIGLTVLLGAFASTLIFLRLMFG